jgi:mRNA deadenylase 3'-5' endonuclease subunit Ccr4
MFLINLVKKAFCISMPEGNDNDPIPEKMVPTIYKDLYKSIGYVVCDGADLTDTMPKIKVMSYNILAKAYQRQPSKWDFNREERICDVIFHDSPDIVGIQEADTIKDACLTRLKG